MFYTITKKSQHKPLDGVSAGVPKGAAEGPLQAHTGPPHAHPLVAAAAAFRVPERSEINSVLIFERFRTQVTPSVHKAKPLKPKGKRGIRGGSGY